MKKNVLVCFVFSLFALSLYANSNKLCGSKEFLEEVLDSAVPVKNNFDGTAGANGEYVLFGIWPQSKKADNVKIDTSKSEIINGWSCFKGSDQCYYVKVTATPYDDYKFNDGTSIKRNNDYYFLLEPIVWRVVTNDYEGGKLLVSDKILSSGSFGPTSTDRDINGRKIYANNYVKSNVRAWLNGLNGTDYDVENYSGKGFINKAFSVNGINNIKTVNLDNSAKSTGYSGSDLKKVEKYVCNNTSDKIFLLSESEVTNNNYGFADYKDSDKLRRRQTTDYARATVAYSNSSSDFLNNGWWWLRSPNSHYSNFARGVKFDGDANSNYSIAGERRAGGFVPALVISF